MKSLATRLMLTAFLCCQCHSQSPEQHLAYAVDAAIAKMEALSQRFEEMGTQMNTKFEEMENTMSSKLEELEGKMDIIQGQLAELQGSSNVEGVLELCAETMEMEREFQREVLNQTCNNMDQMANLQESFSTEFHRIDRSIKGCSSKVSNLQELLQIDECAAADSNDCSPVSSCQDKMILYRCDCDPGYAGDGFTCEEVDECSSTGANSCHRYAVCNNHAGGYTCTCDPGYSGDGFNCEVVDECSSTSENSCHRYAVCNNHAGGYTCTCDPGYSGDGFNCEGCGTDFTDVPGVGCLKASEEGKTFDDASTHCSTLDAQLVVTQNFQALQDYVDSLPSITDYAIGVSNRKWMDGRDVGLDIWYTGHPLKDVTLCGFIYPNHYGIKTWSCDSSLGFICQLKYKSP